MQWRDSIMEIYWELRPCKETQDLYRSKGLDTFHYWWYELDWLLNSTWNAEDAEFRALPGVDYLFEGVLVGV